MVVVLAIFPSSHMQYMSDALVALILALLAMTSSQSLELDCPIWDGGNKTRVWRCDLIFITSGY